MTYASVLWVPGYSDKVYPDREAYMDEVIGLMTQIRRRVRRRGLRLLPARLSALHPPGQR